MQQHWNSLVQTCVPWYWESITYKHVLSLDFVFRQHLPMYSWMTQNSLRRPSWPQTHCLLLAFGVLGLKVCAIIPDSEKYLKTNPSVITVLIKGCFLILTTVYAILSNCLVFFCALSKTLGLNVNLCALEPSDLQHKVGMFCCIRLIPSFMHQKASPFSRLQKHFHYFFLLFYNSVFFSLLGIS